MSSVFREGVTNYFKYFIQINLKGKHVNNDIKMFISGSKRTIGVS